MQNNDFRRPFFQNSERCPEQSLRLPWKTKNTKQKGYRKRAESRAHAAKQVIVFSFRQPDALSLARVGAKNRHVADCGCTVLEIYSACSANNGINKPSPHINAHNQVPPVQIWGFCRLPISQTDGDVIECLHKASNNLHRKAKNDWWPRSTISKCYHFLKSALSFSMPSSISKK